MVKCQKPTKPLLLSFIRWTVGKKTPLLGQDKDRGIKQHSTLSQAQQAQLGEISFFYYQSNQSRVVSKKPQNLKNTFLPLLPLSQFNFTPNFLSLFTPLAQGDGKCGCSQLLIVSAPPSLSGEVLLILCPCSITGSFPWQTGLHELLQPDSFPQCYK